MKSKGSFEDFQFFHDFNDMLQNGKQKEYKPSRDYYAKCDLNKKEVILW